MFPHGVPHRAARGVVELWPRSPAVLQVTAAAMIARVPSQAILGHARGQAALVTRLWRARQRKGSKRWAGALAPSAKKRPKRRRMLNRKAAEHSSVSLRPQQP
eukprot:4225335-Alexandrium_andersonii.AAC.1